MGTGFKELIPAAPSSKVKAEVEKQLREAGLENDKRIRLAEAKDFEDQ